MKVLITGANGLLGQHLVKQLLEKGYTVIATGKGNDRIRLEGWGDRYTYHTLDITDATDVQAVMDAVKPDVVVHAAAMTQVDECELHSEQCERTNVMGTSQILVDAEVYSKHFIYVSTDFVFDGGQGNYKEEDELKPVSYYGFTKMQAEAITETSTIPWAIVRTCLVYGNTLQGTRNNIITWVKNSLEQDKPIKVVADQWRTPTYVEDLAKGIVLIIEKKATGIYHISGKDLLTPYDMAIQTADLFNLDKGRIEKVDASTFNQPGRRPPKTGFVIDKARKELDYEPVSFTEGLKKMFGLLTCFLLLLCSGSFGQDSTRIQQYAQKLKKAYPDCISDIKDNYVLFKNGVRLLFDDGKRKTLSQQYAESDIEDQLRAVYVKGKTPNPAELDDPGRIRNDSFFKAMYGATPAAVQQNLVTITWLPKTVKQQLRVSRINGVDKKLQAISDELEKLPANLLPYVQQVAGTFTWRVIKGTTRLSTHSFGITMDINTHYSNYWQWDNKTTDERIKIPTYINRIPLEIVAIFEKHGFIWGGKWYHYDTMHFEYRPELLVD